MKTNTPTRDIFGLTNAQMAALLNVSPSLYSMYELGLRSLPPYATQLLSEMLTHMQASQAKRPARVDNTLLRSHLERELHENAYQRAIVERKIAAVEKKRTAVQRLLQLSDFLEARNADKSKAGTIPLHPIATKAARASHTDHDAMLVRLALKQELLDLEKNFLESKLQK